MVFRCVELDKEEILFGESPAVALSESMGMREGIATLYI